MALGVSWLATRLAISYAHRRNLFDHPDDSRRSHEQTTPRGGGIGIPLVITLALLGLYWFGLFSAKHFYLLLGSVLVIAAVGWLDDHRDMSSQLRLVVQLLVCMLFVLLGPAVTDLNLPFVYLDLGFSGFGLSVLGMVWLINLYNFMDGIDGIASSQGIFVCLMFGGLFTLDRQYAEAAVCLAASGACVGFFYWNFPRARIFMGDVGSLVIGLVVAYAVLQGDVSGAVSLPVGLLISSVFVVDATATLIRRLYLGERVLAPHREHAYQLLVRTGCSHVQVTLSYAALNLCFVLPIALWAARDEHTAWWLLIGVCVLLSAAWWVVQHRCRRILRENAS